MPTTPVLLAACPSCGHEHAQAAFDTAPPSDNTLGRLAASLLHPDLADFDFKAHLRSEWAVCQNCALMFARRRPSSVNLEKWYPPLFQQSEERGYNTAPLPQRYIDGKKRAAERLFAQLQQHGLFDKAQSLIQLRTGPGHFIEMVRNAYPAIDAYGLEYFEHPANFAKSLVGEDRIARIAVPEPANPFARKSFDLVIANHFFTHAHEPRQFLTYLRGLLSESGTLVLYNELDHALSLKSMTAYPRGLNFFHKQLFTRSTLKAFAESCGFTVQDLWTPERGRAPKYITLICRKAEPQAIAPGNSGKALALLRSWRRRHRFYNRFKPVIDPLRKLLG